MDILSLKKQIRDWYKSIVSVKQRMYERVARLAQSDASSQEEVEQAEIELLNANIQLANAEVDVLEVNRAPIVRMFSSEEK